MAEHNPNRNSLSVKERMAMLSAANGGAVPVMGFGPLPPRLNKQDSSGSVNLGAAAGAGGGASSSANNAEANAEKDVSMTTTNDDVNTSGSAADVSNQTQYHDVSTTGGASSEPDSTEPSAKKPTLTLASSSEHPDSDVSFASTATASPTHAALTRPTMSGLNRRRPSKELNLSARMSTETRISKEELDAVEVVESKKRSQAALDEGHRLVSQPDQRDLLAGESYLVARLEDLQRMMTERIVYLEAEVRSLRGALIAAKIALPDPPPAPSPAAMAMTPISSLEGIAATTNTDVGASSSPATLTSVKPKLVKSTSSPSPPKLANPPALPGGSGRTLSVRTSLSAGEQHDVVSPANSVASSSSETSSSLMKRQSSAPVTSSSSTGEELASGSLASPSEKRRSVPPPLPAGVARPPTSTAASVVAAPPPAPVSPVSPASAKKVPPPLPVPTRAPPSGGASSAAAATAPDVSSKKDNRTEEVARDAEEDEEDML